MVVGRWGMMFMEFGSPFCFRFVVVVHKGLSDTGFCMGMDVLCLIRPVADFEKSVAGEATLHSMHTE